MPVIPFIFDPGQGLPMFDGEDLLAFIQQASIITVNDYEGEHDGRAYRPRSRAAGGR